MTRATLGVVLALLVLAPGAVAAPVGVRDDTAATAVALAGSDAIVLREPRRGGAQVLAVPLGGGPARTLLSVKTPSRAFEDAIRRLAASEQRVAVIVESEDDNGNTLEWRVYSGTPSGPLQLVHRAPGTGPWLPAIVDADGDQVLLVEVSQGGDNLVRAHLIGPTGLVPVAWARPAFVPVAIAGGHAAVLAAGPRRYAVADLVTGAERFSAPDEWEGLRVDIAPDGRLVTVTEDGLLSLGPGAPPRLLLRSRELALPAAAGAATAAVHDSRPVLFGPDGSRTPLGAASTTLTDLTADASGVAWIANGCVWYAGSRPARPGGDRCPSSEINFFIIASSRLRGAFVRAPVRCIDAASGTCRGTVLARHGRRVVGRARFAVPAGKLRNVPVRLDRRTVARFRRAGWGGLTLGAKLPDGRVGEARGDAELTVKVR